MDPFTPVCIIYGWQ